ncbi:sos-response repressor and protease lexa [hydrocarbon metagenome]|uniref:Sos-response repressor and protease lexa n=1 Tax=hydrocarbon metagenome TaxID=938273 RepID=A0A0W8E3K7_9ZZZZ
MESFGERLRRLRENKNLTQEQLGKILNVKKSAISKYETDKISMNIESIKLLARYFDVPLSYLIDVDIDSIRTSSKIPFLGRVHTGTNMLAVDNIESYLAIPEYLSADFVLKVSGDSMIGAGILNGDLALCRLSAKPQPGQIIAVIQQNMTEEFSEIFLRYYFNEAGQPVLKSANPDYPDIDYQTNAYSSVGKLSAIIRLQTPDYEVYTEYLNIKNNEEWLGVIEAASEYGLSPQDILASVNIQAKILKKMKTP